MHKAVGAASALREWKTGWALVLCATIGVAVAGMHYPVMATLMRPLTEAYGWTRGQAALGLTVMAFISPLASVIAGASGDRFGPRRVVLVGTVSFGLGFALFALAGPALWTWYAASAMFAVLGHFISPVVWTMAVVRHFNASRGLALALTLSGSGAVASLMPGIVLGLQDTAGLRGTFVALAVGGSLLTFVPALFLFHESGPAQTTATRHAASAALPGMTVRQALAGTRFWRLLTALLLVGMTVGTFILHYQSMLGDAGLSPAQVAAAALIIGPAMIIGRLGTGLLFDRLPTALVAGCAFSVLAIACGLMLVFNGTVVMAVGVGAIIGLGVGAEVDVVAFLTSRYFGLRRYGLLLGLLLGLYGVGVGSGSALAGKVFDRAGSYDPLLIVLALGCLIAGLLVATLGRPDDGEPQPAV